MLFALNSLKLSAQSPPCKRKALPMAASASFSSRCLASPANTIGGKASRVFSTESRSFWSGYSGSCSAGLDFQLSSVHFEGEAATDEGDCFVEGSAAWTAEIRVRYLELRVLAEGTREWVGWWCGVERVWVLLYKDLDERVAVFERAIVQGKRVCVCVSFLLLFLLLGLVELNLFSLSLFSFLGREGGRDRLRGCVRVFGGPERKRWAEREFYRGFRGEEKRWVRWGWLQQSN